MTKDILKIAVMGASGRMGQALIHAVVADAGLALVGAGERAGHEWIGRDIGACLRIADTGVKVEDDALEIFTRADAVIDFTHRDASVLHAELAAQARCVLVIGTTGFIKGQLDKITKAGAHARIIRSGNMSVGVNLLAALTRQVAGVLDDGFDIEILESHHRHKLDAPSGTALILGHAAADGRGVDLPDVVETGRDGADTARAQGAIGMHSVRGGDIVGEHEVIFAGEGERIVLRHIATDRNIFVRGALRAARWGLEQPVGLYSMYDVLGMTGQGIKINS